MTEDLISKLRTGLLSGLCLTGLTAGCGSPLNVEDGLLGENPLPAVCLSPKESISSPPTIIQGDIVPLDRSAWTRRIIPINQAQVEHHPSYGSARPVIGRLNSRDVYPSLETSFSDGSNIGDEALNGVLAPLAAAVELVILPVRMIITPPWSVMESPSALRIAVSPDEDLRSVRTAWLGSETNDEKE